jgi:hypothetical protein
MSASATPSGSPGGRKKSPLWLYFEYNSTIDKSVCQIDGCAWKCSGKNPTYPKTHLQKMHLASFREYEAKIKVEEGSISLKRRKNVVEKGQMKTTDFFKSVSERQFSAQHPEQLQLVRKMAIAFTCSNIPLLATENPAMRQWMTAMNGKFIIPGRGRLEQEYSRVHTDLQDEMVRLLKNARNIQIIVDVWSKRGLSESFLGVRARFYCDLDDTIRTLTLAVRKFPSPHTGKIFI